MRSRTRGQPQPVAAARETTKAYLTEFYRIDPKRLVVRAFGEDYLLFPDYPTDGRNRRWKFRTLQ